MGKRYSMSLVALRVVRELLGVVRAHPHVALAKAVAEVPRDSLLDPVCEPLLGLGRRDEVLHLHLLELERPEDEVAGRDLVAERLADLRDPEGRLAARDLRDVLEVDEDALRGLRSEVRVLPRLLDRTDPRLEHEVEHPGSVRSQSGVSPGRLLGLRPQRTSSCSGSARWSARKRSLHVRQSTSGSAKPDTWPEASHTAGLRMIDESSATMSSRSRTIASSQRAFTFSLSRTP